MTSWHRLNGLSGAEGARSGRENHRAHRYRDNRDGRDHGGRKDNAKTSEQAPFTPTATCPSAVLRQGNPFVRPCSLDAGCRIEDGMAYRLRAHAVNRRAASPLHLT